MNKTIGKITLVSSGLFWVLLLGLAIYAFLRIFVLPSGVQDENSIGAFEPFFNLFTLLLMMIPGIAILIFNAIAFLATKKNYQLLGLIMNLLTISTLLATAFYFLIGVSL